MSYINNNINYTDSRDRRCIVVAQYIIDENATVRSAAKKFGISKSTVHKDITLTLEKVNAALAEDVKKVLEKNKEERHIRGGEATRMKYLMQKMHGERIKQN